MNCAAVDVLLSAGLHPQIAPGGTVALYGDADIARLLYPYATKHESEIKYCLLEDVNRERE